MRKLTAALLTLSALLTAAELSLDRQNWYGNPLAWKKTADGFTTGNSAGPLRFIAAPLSENCEVEAVITPTGRIDTSYATAGIGLWADDQNYYKLSLVEAPLAQKSIHFAELHQRYKSNWPDNHNLIVKEQHEPIRKWQYNTSYRLKLSKNGRNIIGTIEDLNGTLLFRQSMTFKDDTPVNFVRPFLGNGSMLASYRNLNASWSGKTITDAESQNDFPAYFSKSYVPGRNDAATGFFHVKKDDDGRWWAYDPLGRGFVVFGIDHVSYAGHGCEILNRYLHREYNDKRFKNKAEWEDETLTRLTTWGFNMLMGGDGNLRQRGMAHAINLGIGTKMARFGDEYDITTYKNAPCTAFPNVFHPQFREWVVYCLETSCRKQANNPWLFGYFIDNELRWWGKGRSDSGLFDAILDKAPSHSARQALHAYLRQRADNSIQRFNDFWHTRLNDFNGLNTLKSLPTQTPEQVQCKLDFLRIIAERYFSTVRDELRKIDPNHLLLGCRFAGIDGSHPVVWEVAGKYSDVLTWNYYGNVDLDTETALSDRRPFSNGEPLTEDFKRVYEWAGRPCLITEWSFPAIDSGLPCTRGAGQRFNTQAERARATEIFAKTMLTMPFLIGYDYFMWVDQPPLGINHDFPENSNYGIINLKGEPYPGLVKLFTEIQNNPEKYRLADVPAAKPAPPAKHPLYDRYLAPHKPQTGDCPIRFTQNSPTSFRADTGRFQVYTTPDQPRLMIDFDGAPLGSFCALAFYIDRANRPLWSNVSTLQSITLLPEPDRLTITVNASFEPPANQPQARPFSMIYRLVLLPDTDWMLADIINIKHPEDTPLILRGLFLRFYARFDDKPDIAAENTLERAVPRLWKAPKLSGWFAPDLKRYFYFACGDRDDMRLHCWHDPKLNSYHPDLARLFPDGITVPPRGSYAPDVPLYLLALAGQGSLFDIQQRAIKIWQ